MNNISIVTSICEDEQFIKNLFTMINSSDTPLEKLRDGLKFLREYNVMVKSVLINLKNNVYMKLVNNGLLQIIESKLRHSDQFIRFVCSELLLSIMSNNPSLVQEYIAKKKENDVNSSLLEVIVEGIINETELGIQDTLTELLKLLLDPELMSKQENAMYEMFYGRPMGLLVSPFSHPEQYSTSSQTHVLDILSFIVQHHGYRSRGYIIKHNVIKKAVSLLDTTVQKDLILAIIRFFKICVSLHETFYDSNIIRHHLFEPLMKVWRENADKYNLINSSIINLFELILKGNFRTLISHIVTFYRSDLEKVDYVETFQLLLTQYAQNEELELSNKEGTYLEKDKQDEDSYFEESDDESKKTELSSLSLASTSAPTATLPDLTKVEPNGKETAASISSDELVDNDLFFSTLTHSKNTAEEEDDDFLSSTDSSNSATSQQAHPIRINITSRVSDDSLTNGQSPQSPPNGTTSSNNQDDSINSKKRSQEEILSEHSLVRSDQHNGNEKSISLDGNDEFVNKKRKLSETQHLPHINKYER